MLLYVVIKSFFNLICQVAEDLCFANTITEDEVTCPFICIGATAKRDCNKRCRIVANGDLSACDYISDSTDGFTVRAVKLRLRIVNVYIGKSRGFKKLNYIFRALFLGIYTVILRGYSRDRNTCGHCNEVVVVISCGVSKIAVGVIEVSGHLLACYSVICKYPFGNGICCAVHGNAFGSTHYCLCEIHRATCARNSVFHFVTYKISIV